MPTPEMRKARYVALAWGAGLGPAGFRRVVAHFGSPAAVIAASEQDLALPSLRLDPGQIQLISSLRSRLDTFRAELAQLKQECISVYCDWEEGFPALLKGIRNPPVVVCIAGRLLPEDDPAIAIIGTRTPSPDGARMARDLGAAFARTGTTVVAGLARGCDTEAHYGALEAGGRTIAVLGSGIRVITPRENLSLARLIFERGAVLSEQPPSAQPTTATLMARNRLQSALSRGVIVVEARATGGSINTAESALDQGRLLLAVRWPDDRETAAGNNALIQRGALPVRGPGDAPDIRLQIADHIGRMKSAAKVTAIQPSLFPDGD
ncbi:MAG: DNA-protecting protein DprA [Armatimonadetes bacterium]|nr:DNA-protecting protein DprA [Armatimonadota bacterium]